MSEPTAKYRSLAEFPPATRYDAVLVVSFGGPEGPDEVLPFLENVLRGRNVPRERLLEVAEHYQHFGGVSPLNAQNRALVAALSEQLQSAGPPLPIYWGNRNWHPLLADTVRQMAADDIRRAIAYVTAGYSSYSSCRQYLENIATARGVVGPAAPEIDKLRAFYNHPLFIAAMTDRVREALARLPAPRRDSAPLVYTAHSIPLAMAETSRYQEQLDEAARLVSLALGRGEYQLVFQSRSGPASQPWLEPDVNAWLRQHARSAASRDVVLAPIGFLSDHMEVIYDLDFESQAVCNELGLNLVRAATVGVHPHFIAMIRDLIIERMSPGAARAAIGKFAASHDECALDCCPAPQRARPPA